MSEQSVPTAVLRPLGAHLGKPAIPLKRLCVVIGSRNNAHIHLVSSTVSKAHAIIVNSNGRHYIRDLNSRTKVLVNGNPVVDHDLTDGDQIQIGRFEFEYELPDGGLATPRAKAVEPGQLVYEGAAIDLTGRAVTLGRRGACDIAIGDETVSTVHAVIFEMSGRRFIRDLGSRTGTFLNNNLLHQEELRNNDRVKIGPGILAYVETAATPAARPTRPATPPPPEAPYEPPVVPILPLRPTPVAPVAAPPVAVPPFVPTPAPAVAPPTILPPPELPRISTPPAPPATIDDDLPTLTPTVDDVLPAPTPTVDDVLPAPTPGEVDLSADNLAEPEAPASIDLAAEIAAELNAPPEIAPTELDLSTDPAADELAPTEPVAADLATEDLAPAEPLAAEYLAPTEPLATDLATEELATTEPLATDLVEELAPAEPLPTDLAVEELAPTEPLATDLVEELAPAEPLPTDLATEDLAPTDPIPTDLAAEELDDDLGPALHEQSGHGLELSRPADVDEFDLAPEPPAPGLQEKWSAEISALQPPVTDPPIPTIADAPAALESDEVIEIGDAAQPADATSLPSPLDAVAVDDFTDIEVAQSVADTADATDQVVAPEEPAQEFPVEAAAEEIDLGLLEPAEETAVDAITEPTAPPAEEIDLDLLTEPATESTVDAATEPAAPAEEIDLDLLTEPAAEIGTDSLAQPIAEIDLDSLAEPAESAEHTPTPDLAFTPPAAEILPVEPQLRFDAAPQPDPDQDDADESNPLIVNPTDTAQVELELGPDSPFAQPPEDDVEQPAPTIDAGPFAQPPPEEIVPELIDPVAEPEVLDVDPTAAPDDATRDMSPFEFRRQGLAHRVPPTGEVDLKSAATTPIAEPPAPQPAPPAEVAAQAPEIRPARPPIEVTLVEVDAELPAPTPPDDGLLLPSTEDEAAAAHAGILPPPTLPPAEPFSWGQPSDLLGDASAADVIPAGLSVFPAGPTVEAYAGGGAISLPEARDNRPRVWVDLGTKNEANWDAPAPDSPRPTRNVQTSIVDDPGIPTAPPPPEVPADQAEVEPESTDAAQPAEADLEADAQLAEQAELAPENEVAPESVDAIAEELPADQAVATPDEADLLPAEEAAPANPDDLTIIPGGEYVELAVQPDADEAPADPNSAELVPTDEPATDLLADEAPAHPVEVDPAAIIGGSGGEWLDTQDLAEVPQDPPAPDTADPTPIPTTGAEPWAMPLEVPTANVAPKPAPAIPAGRGITRLPPRPQLFGKQVVPADESDDMDEPVVMDVDVFSGMASGRPLDLGPEEPVGGSDFGGGPVPPVSPAAATTTRPGAGPVIPAAGGAGLPTRTEPFTRSVPFSAAGGVVGGRTQRTVAGKAEAKAAALSTPPAGEGTAGDRGLIADAAADLSQPPVDQPVDDQPVEEQPADEQPDPDSAAAATVVAAVRRPSMLPVPASRPASRRRRSPVALLLVGMLGTMALAAGGIWKFTPRTVEGVLRYPSLEAEANPDE